MAITSVLLRPTLWCSLGERGECVPGAERAIIKAFATCRGVPGEFASV